MSNKKKVLAKQLARVAVIALVRGCAAATGTGLVSLVVWWLTKR